MNEITLKLTDRELVLLTALLGRTDGDDLYKTFDICREQVDLKVLEEEYYYAYEVIGRGIDMFDVAKEVFGE